MSDTATIETPPESAALVASARSIRFRDTLSLDTLANTHILIIGCGAVGSCVAKHLAQSGFSHLTLCDPDTVSAANLGPQGFYPSQLNTLKVDALAEQLLQINPLLNLDLHPSRYDPSLVPLSPIVVCCVDSMTARTSIWSAIEPWIDLFIDTRMTLWSGDVYTAFTHAQKLVPHPFLPNTLATEYALTLHSDTESPGLPCTNRSSPWAAQQAALLATASIIRYLRDPSQPTSPVKVSFNLLIPSVEESNCICLLSEPPPDAEKTL